MTFGKQEPVAGMHTSGHLAPWHKHWEGRPEYAGWKPLYSAPPEPAPQEIDDLRKQAAALTQENLELREIIQAAIDSGKLGKLK